MTLTGNFLKSLSVLALTFNIMASSDVWQNYYPNMDCNKNHCAKDVPSDALEQLLEKGSYFHPKKLKRTNWMFLVDMRIHSSKKRGFLINTKTGATKAYHVAHGSGTGDGKGNAFKFSNTKDSHMSSLGLYVTGQTYSGKHGYSLKMKGLESTNSNAMKRHIVMHGATYMTKGFINKYGRAGRSWGCPAVAPKHNKELVDKLKNGSLIYIHY
jgi:hypothetical protein